MTEKVIVWYECHSCENCHFGQREQYGKIRCKEDVSVEFVQNKDMGVPKGCPFRKRKREIKEPEAMSECLRPIS